MTRDEAREFAKVVQAYADGKDVQAESSRGWEVVPPPIASLNPCVKWRIRPEPREWWMVLDCDGDDCGIYKTIASAERGRNYVAESGCLIPYTIVHVREVLP